MDMWHPLRKCPESHIDTQLEVHTLQESINRGTNPQKKGNGVSVLLIFLYVLVELGLPKATIQLIMLSVSSVSYQICVDGELTEPFQPRNCIRQGDPFSPYLFVLCVEKLSHIIFEVVQKEDTLLAALVLEVLFGTRWEIGEKNGVADSLASWSYNMDLGLCIFAYAPSWLGSKIVEDLLGVSKARLVCLNYYE
ncbi:unnamed protein product [Prunus brigantina]